MRKSNIWMLVVTCLLACKNDETFRLERYTFRNDDIDTVAYFANYDMYLIELKDYRFLGDFKSEYIFVGRKDIVGYKIDGDNLQVELSKKYLGLVKEGDKSYGWFNIKQHKIISSMPKVDSILTRLEKSHTNQFVQESNGIFTVYNKGKLLKKLNLGEFLVEKDSINYDDLEFGIYQVKNASLVKINNDGTKLLEQKDGLYFIPSPGFDVVVFRKLSDILPKVSSALKRHPLPEEIRIK